MTIVNPEAGSGVFRVEESAFEDTHGLRGYTVDELVGLVSQGVLFIVKLDIEGSQRELFSSNVGWVEQAGLIILELDDWQFPWQTTSYSFFQAVSRHRFDYLIRGENIFCFRY